MSMFMDLPARVAKVFGREPKIMEVRFFFVDEDDNPRYPTKEEEAENIYYKTIKKIYEDILIYDREWHFFLEGWYYIIRCSEQFYNEVCYELEQAGFVLDEKGVWVDEQGPTRKYQEIFQPMFHSFSVMAMQDYEYEELERLFDRVSHCFLNHQQAKWLYDERAAEDMSIYWEPKIIHNYGMKRMEYIADINGYNKGHKAGYYKGRTMKRKLDAFEDLDEYTEEELVAIADKLKYRFDEIITKYQAEKE